MRRTVTANRAGQSLVEFALLATVLFMLLIGIFEFGRAYYYYSAIVNAAQEGARYGSVTGVNTAAKQDAIKNTVAQSAIAVGVITSSVTVLCAGSCNSVGAGGQFTVSVGYTFTAVTPLLPSFQINGQSSMMIDHSP